MFKTQVSEFQRFLCLIRQHTLAAEAFTSERVETLGPVSQTVDPSPHVGATLSMSQQSASPIFSGLIFSFKNTIATITMQHLSQCHNEDSSTESQQIKNIIKSSCYINVVSMMLLGY